MNSVRAVITLASVLLGATPWLAASLRASERQGPSPKSELITTVREATERFRDVRDAAPDYVPILGCVAGPDAGAMGMHYLNPALMDEVLDPRHPEALIYEFKNGTARLVGVEFIVTAEAWHKNHGPQDVPVINGQQLLNFVDSPNRFGLPAFYELHVWAWRDNPNGAFVDWHPHVTCEG